SRRRHTRLVSDWSSDVCSSDLAFTINHNGTPYTFNLDCSRPDIVCPGEAWPNQVIVEQRDVQHQHQMVVDLPSAKCDSALTQPEIGRASGRERGEISGDGGVVK